MIIPRFLSEGQRIGVTAPSFGVTDPTDKNRFDNAKSRLASMGHPVVETPDVYTADESGRSAPAGQRVMELASLLEDPTVGYIVSAKGGDYQFEMLLHMDWDHMERHPKWIQGYSDNTTLLFKITAEHDIATIYGGNFGDYGMEPWHRSVSENLEVVEGRRTVQGSFPYHEVGFADRVTGLEGLREEAPVEWVSPSGDVRFTGRLIGGCMDVLEWFHRKATADPRRFIERYAGDGIVWYMETYDMDESRIRAMLSGMERDGWFEGVTGFVFGRSLFYSGGDYVDVVSDALSGFDVPKVFGADIGHKAPRMTIVNGAVATFDVRGGSCTLEYDFGR
ncbi:MAG: LD-carboxypeptidase [Candidatus Methanomethylophilaceae archaeon]|nr:LD-carboxypeptidase [Candidatus Methanomethylophilaceae archaeon]